MIIFPAIDIKGGKCVRLLKGDFNKVTKYNKTPLEQAKEFFDLGFKNLHIIDLDGALEGSPINGNIIQDIGKINDIKIQVGGGIRSPEHIKKLLDFGVDKAIVGTAAIKNIKFLKNVCDQFQNKIALSLDVRNGYIALAGWKTQTDILALDFIKKVKNVELSRIIYTDINRDGTKTSPNIKETLNFSKIAKIPTIISGGVSSIDDIMDIKNKNFTNIEGVIVGKAIYDGNIDITKLCKVN